MINPAFNELAVYPFWRLAKLLEGVSKPEGIDEIALQIGEPKIPQATGAGSAGSTGSDQRAAASGRHF